MRQNQILSVIMSLCMLGLSTAPSIPMNVKATDWGESIERAEGDIALDETHFPCSIFREKIAANADTDKDGILTVEEQNAVTTLSLLCGNTADESYKSTRGLEYFPNLEYLYLASYHIEEPIDLSKNTKLTTLKISGYGAYSDPMELDLSKNLALKEIDFLDVKPVTLDLSMLTQLETIKLNRVNNVNSIDISKNTNLKSLSFYYMENKCKDIDFSKYANLESIELYQTNMPYMDLSKNTQIQSINVRRGGSNATLSYINIGYVPQTFNVDAYVYNVSNATKRINLTEYYPLIESQNFASEIYNMVGCELDGDQLVITAQKDPVTGVCTASYSIGKVEGASIATTVNYTNNLSCAFEQGNTYAMAIGQKDQLRLSFSPEDFTYDSAEWSSDNASVVAVDEEGNIQAKAIGEATITCVINDEYEISCKVTVDYEHIDGDMYTIEGTKTAHGVWAADQIRILPPAGYVINLKGEDAYKETIELTGIHEANTLEIRLKNKTTGGLTEYYPIKEKVGVLREVKGSISMADYCYGESPAEPRITITAGNTSLQPRITYQKGEDELGSNAPTEVGRYLVKAVYPVDYEEGYLEAEFIDEFEVTYMDMPEIGYTIQGTKTAHGIWGKEFVRILAPEGYVINLKGEDAYKETIELTGIHEANTLELRYKNRETGAQSQYVPVVEYIGVDGEAPKGRIEFAKGSACEDLKQDASIAQFIENKETITLTGEDALSGMKKIEYVMSNTPLLSGKEITHEALEEAVAGIGGWLSYQEGLVLNKPDTYYVYGKFQDQVGNVSYVNTAGIVIYTPAALDCKTVSYELNDSQVRDIHFTANGNHFVGLKQADLTLTEGKEYTLKEGEGNGEYVIALNTEYLCTLKEGSYTFDVIYGPLDLEEQLYTLSFILEVTSDTVVAELADLVDGKTYYGEQVIFKVDKRMISKVSINGTDADLTNPEIVLESKKGRIHYEIMVTDIRNRSKTYHIIVAANWMKNKTIPIGEAIGLYCEDSYQLGDGTWKVSGDTTVYQGGITFYVGEDGEYTFSQFE